MFVSCMTVTVIQSVRTFVLQAKVWFSNPICNSPKSSKKVVTDPMHNAQQQVWVLQDLNEDNSK